MRTRSSPANSIAPAAPYPFENENDLPASLKPFVATPGAVEPYHPVERNVYQFDLADLTPLARRQVHRLQQIAEEKEWAEQVASEELPPETAAALRASHDLHIGAALKQAEVSAKLADAAYEAAQPAPPRELFVKRGGEMGRPDRCRLKPGELIFALTPAGEYEAVGHTNSNAEIPNELTSYDIQT